MRGEILQVNYFTRHIVYLPKEHSYTVDFCINEDFISLNRVTLEAIEKVAQNLLDDVKMWREQEEKRKNRNLL